MGTAFIRFYEELNDLLPPHKRKVDYPVSFRENPSVKSIIEGENVPHTEVDLVLVNGRSVPFHEKIGDGDRISVYPEFESFDITGMTLVRLKPLREPRFVLDVHLGKLTRRLRMLGLDSAYDNRWQDEELARISVEEKRSLLTRDKKLLMRKEITRGYWIRSEAAEEQTAEVISRFDLARAMRLFSLCTLCNGRLEAVPEATARLHYPDHRFRPGTVFYRCDSCSHIYWNGSHCERFAKRVFFSP